ncbi:22585_t:CDS:2 [Gigaspora rosea]|nr:22585_t:CDS:2 [Gigaspora rosea]
MIEESGFSTAFKAILKSTRINERDDLFFMPTFIEPSFKT